MITRLKSTYMVTFPLNGYGILQKKVTETKIQIT